MKARSEHPELSKVAAAAGIAPREREVETALRDFLRIVLERDARSLAFLDEIRHEPVALPS